MADDAEDGRTRLFLAVLPNERVRDELCHTQREVAPLLAKGRPTSRGNLHLTLAFIGMCDAGEREAAARALRVACGQSRPLSLALGGMGVFERRRGGGVVWQGVADGPGLQGLARLQASLVQALADQGLGDRLPDTASQFCPHITLFRGARPKGGWQPVVGDGGEGRLSSPPARPVGTQAFDVQSASLMWSHHPEGGELTYDELLRVPLGGA